MAWQSAFTEAKFSEPLVAQLVAILYRDLEAALDFVSGDPGSLKTVAEWDLATVTLQNFPALVVVPHADRFDEESQQSLHQTIPISMAVAITHQDPNVCARRIQQYVRAINEVLYAAWRLTPSDFGLTNLPLPSPPYAAHETSPGLAAKLMRLFVAQHSYEELYRSRQGLFATAATLSLECDLEEA